MAGAFALDLTLGDPPNRWHPVAWLGRAIDAGRRRLAHGPAPRLLVSGACLTLAAAVAAALAAWGVAGLARALGPPGALLEGVALWTLLSVRGLARAAHLTGDALARGDLAAARLVVGFHLVSRATDRLDDAQVASAAIESVSENLTDSVLGPVVFYLLFGLPGAAAYRAVNTADAMIGYRDGALEHFGKLAARLDDLLNLIPARLAGAALALAATAPGFDAAGAWRVMWRQHGRTASPNAGWPMAAMAGALGVTLEKPGAYRLGDARRPASADIRRSVRLLGAATAISVGLALGARILAAS